jgi:3-oxocholest-4-en-26-oyl-CoA dehydrogenase alpha subunit
MSWSKEYGGLGLSAVEQFIFFEEFRYAGAPHPFGAAVSIVAQALFRFGTEENRQIWLPPII